MSNWTYAFDNATVEQRRTVRRCFPKLRGEHNQCAACGEFFNSMKSFDKHRTGKYNKRRCLTTDEMFGRGMLRNKDFYWITETRLEYVQE